MASRKLARCEAHGLAYDPDVQQGCTLCRNSLRPKENLLTREVSGKDVAMAFLMVLWVVFVISGAYFGVARVKTLATQARSKSKVAGPPAPMPGAPVVGDTSPVLPPLPVPTDLPMLRRPGLGRYGYPSDAVDEVGLRVLLDAGEFARLTRYIEQIQTEFEADFRKEEWITQAFDAFSTADPKVGERIEAWAKATPDSFAPFLARAEQRVATGWYYRGGKFVGETEKARLDKFREILATAEPDVQAALARRPKLVAARQLELWLDTSLGKPAQREVLDAALAACPACFRIRSKYEVSLSPRWGGSLERMEAFATESQRDVATNPRLKVLLGYADEERCRIFQDKENYVAALDACGRAVRAGDFGRFFDSRADVLLKLDRIAEALEAWDRAVDDAPQMTSYLASRGVARIRTGRLEDGTEDIRTAYRLDPLDSTVKWSVGAGVEWLIVKGYDRSQSGDDPGAIVAFDLALSLSPHDENALSRKVRAGSRMAATDEVGRLEASARADPTNFETFKKLDDELVKTREFPRIIGHWTRYLEAKPDDARANLERGGAYTQLHDREHALSDLDRACSAGLQSGCDGVRYVRERVPAASR